MSDLISRDRAQAYLIKNAEEIARNMAERINPMPKDGYADGFIDGYLAAAKSVGHMLSDDVIAMLEAMQSEAAQ